MFSSFKLHPSLLSSMLVNLQISNCSWDGILSFNSIDSANFTTYIYVSMIRPLFNCRQVTYHLLALEIAIFVAAWIWISTSKNIKYCHIATTKCKLRCIVITLTLILVHMLSIWQNSFPFPCPKCRCFIFKSLVSLQHVTRIKAFWKIVLFRFVIHLVDIGISTGRDKEIFLSQCHFARDKGRNKNPGTNSSFLGQNEFLFI